MAFPAVVNTAETAPGAASATTAQTYTLPSNLVIGNLILIVVSKGTPASTWTFNALAGWTEILDENTASGCAVLARQVDGTEGATADFVASASVRSAAVAYQILGAERLATRAPELSTVATGTSVNPNATTCTPTGGAKDYLWITFFSQVGEEADDDTWVTGTPSNYGSLFQKTGGTAGTNLGALLGTAQRNLNASSEDSGSFTTAVSAAWRAYTVAVHPLLTPIVNVTATMVAP